MEKNYEKNLRSKRGITLIALVVTIIVLLILAGVTIATLTGENGILTQAGKAKTETTKVEALEKVQVEVLGSYGTDGSLDNNTLKNNLNNIKGIEGVPDTISDDDYTLTVTVDGVKIDIEKDGTVSYAFDAEEWDKTACKETSFLWESDDPDSGEAYHTIVGYADSIENEIILKVPSRCHEIRCDYINWNNQGRIFAGTFEIIELPSTTEKIGGYAFNGFNLKSITIPDGVTSIGGSAFYGCSDLTKISIPNSVTSIGWGAFYGCSSLTEIIIPNSVTTVESEAFNNTAWYDNKEDGLVYVGRVAYKYKGTMPENTNIEIKAGTKSITSGAFSGCTGLKSITIPNSITKIGSYAFSGCTSLSSVTIPSSVTNIESGVFQGCSSLTNITIPNSITKIGSYAFSGCTSLSSVTIPSSATSIGMYAFSSCTGLISITIPNSVTSIDGPTFTGWTSFQTINIQGYTSIPSGWRSDWSWNCSATINWGQ